MMEQRRAFADVIKGTDIEPAKPIDAFLAEIDAFIKENNPYDCNRVIRAVRDGTASMDVVKRYAKELYYLGRWMTPELALLVANAPDAHYALSLERSEHFAHWTQNFADETGYLGDPNHVQMKIDHCHQLGISDEEIMSYVPMPETIGSVHTLLYYCRRSYEEGLAAFGYARERAAGQSGYAQMLYDGLKKHYGIAAKNYEVHAYAEEQHGDKALELMRKACITADIQRRVRQAVQHTILTNLWRTHALNRWLEQ
jgi:pyrroloquinoline quinone (PQQ) biosynthesis protein C